MSVNSSDQGVTAAVKAVAKKMNLSETDALKVLVAKGAEEMAKPMGAKAYTTGRTPAFSSSGAGQKNTVGHELSHTLQQSARKIDASR